MSNPVRELFDPMIERIQNFNIRDRATQIALGSIVVVIALVAAVCTIPGDGTDTTAEIATGDGQDAAAGAGDGAGGDGSGEGDGDGGGGGTSAGSTGDGTTDNFTDNPFADQEYQLEVGRSIKPQSTNFPNGNKNTWVGVTGDKIKAVASYNYGENCGTDILAAISAAGATFGSGTRYYRAAPTNNAESTQHVREAIDALVKVTNLRAYEASKEFPNVFAVNEKLGSPERPFFGRKLVYETIDGGNHLCPDKTTAAATEIVQEKKPFVVFNDFDGASFNMAQALNAKAKPENRPMHFGTLWLSDTDYTRWAPFNWTQFNSGTRGAELFSSWLCSRVKGKNATNSEQFSDQKRVFALMYPNLQQSKTVANEMRNFMKKDCGSDPFGDGASARVFEYSVDIEQMPADAATASNRFLLEGVTSVVYLHDPVGPFFHLNTWNGQDNFRPELIWTPSGYYDSNTVQRLYPQAMMDKNSFGITQFGVPGGFGYDAGDAFWAWHDTHKKSPNSGKACDPTSDAGMNHDEDYCKAPGAIATWYYTMLPFSGGTLFAGPDLNPTNVSKGLQSYPPIRYGTNGPTRDPRPAQLGSGPGKHYFIVDATEYRWRSSFIAPPPNSKLGWVEYPDCQRHYLKWPDQYSVNWEKGSSHHNAWCGDAKYAPKPYEPVEGDCGDTPSGVCEKNGYPRWGPEIT